MDSIVLVLSSLGIAQAIFICLYLLTLQKGNRKANLFLALVLLGLAIRIGKSILNVYLDLEPWQRNLGISGLLLVGPFLWFYGRILLAKEKHFETKNYLHLIPFIGFVLFCSIIPNDARPSSLYFYLSIFVHLLIYLGLSIQLFFKFRKQSNPALSNLYRNLLIGICLIWIFYMGNLAGIFPFYIGGAIFFSLLVYMLSFILLKKPLFALEKYANSALGRADSQKHLQRLKELFDNEDLYLDSNLSLHQVAERVGIAPRDLSQVINENERQNFSEFVNHYRIAKAKNLLIDPSYAQEKIATVAYDCGFGNVTSFNLAFKAATQLTPSQYRSKFRLA